MLRRFQASLPDFQSMLTSYADVAKQCTEFKDFSVVEFQRTTPNFKTIEFFMENENP